MSNGGRSIWTSILLTAVAGGSLLAVLLFFKRRRAEAARASRPSAPEPPVIWVPPSPTPEPPTTVPEPAPTSAPVAVSDQGTRFVSGFEGFYSRLYNDPAGHCTIGFGHLVHLGRCNGSEPAEFRRGITVERARELLAGELRQAAAVLTRLVRVPLNQYQFDALGSFVFNVGEGNFRTSTLLRLLNQGDYDSVPAQLNRFVYASGKKLPGLVTRRRAEGRLFATSDYGELMS